MNSQVEQRIEAWTRIGAAMGEDSAEKEAAVIKACIENPWFTAKHCHAAIDHWSNSLNPVDLKRFVEGYQWSDTSKVVGIVMAGNVPLVGLHDLICVSISGHQAVVKTSSEDKALIQFILKMIDGLAPEMAKRISITEQLPKGIDAVIATGSNNSYRYFEHYFRDMPHILRKNRKSIAVLDGNESEEELKRLADDIFSYFGLGCRNVSLLFIPEQMDVTRILDQFMGYKDLEDHHRFANNYTYHKALFLMNQQEHLDTGFVLVKQERDLHVPLGCIFYSTYSDTAEIDDFTATHAEEIQCIVGKNYKQVDVEYGMAQQPELQDFADKVDTLAFLESL